MGKTRAGALKNKLKATIPCKDPWRWREERRKEKKRSYNGEENGSSVEGSEGEGGVFMLEFLQFVLQLFYRQLIERRFKVKKSRQVEA